MVSFAYVGHLGLSINQDGFMTSFARTCKPKICWVWLNIFIDGTEKHREFSSLFLK